MWVSVGGGGGEQRYSYICRLRRVCKCSCAPPAPPSVVCNMLICSSSLYPYCPHTFRWDSAHYEPHYYTWIQIRGDHSKCLPPSPAPANSSQAYKHAHPHLFPFIFIKHIHSPPPPPPPPHTHTHLQYLQFGVCPHFDGLHQQFLNGQVVTLKHKPRIVHLRTARLTVVWQKTFRMTEDQQEDRRPTGRQKINRKMEDRISTGRQINRKIDQQKDGRQKINRQMEDRISTGRQIKKKTEDQQKDGRQKINRKTDQQEDRRSTERWQAEDQQKDGRQINRKMVDRRSTGRSTERWQTEDQQKDGRQKINRKKSTFPYSNKMTTAGTATKNLQCITMETKQKISTTQNKSSTAGNLRRISYAMCHGKVWSVEKLETLPVGTDHLTDRAVARESTQQSPLKRWERPKVWTVSKDMVGKLLRNGVELIWVCLCT